MTHTLLDAFQHAMEARHARALNVKLLWHPKNAPEWLPWESIDGDQHP